jgi:hypothetical protein
MHIYYHFTHCPYHTFYLTTYSLFDSTHRFISSLGTEIKIAAVEGDVVSRDVHTGDTGVRTFALTSDDSFIAVVDVLGKVSIIRMNKEQCSLFTSYPSNDVQKTFASLVAPEVAIKVDDENRGAEMGCKVSWSLAAEKRILAVPSKRGSCVLCFQDVASQMWSDFNLCPDDAEGELSHGNTDLNIASFSPDGEYLATCDISGKIVVWKIDPKKLSACKPINKFAPATAGPLADLVWGQHAGENHLIASSQEGIVKIEPAVNAPVVLPMPAPVAQVAEVAEPVAMIIESSDQVELPPTQSATAKQSKTNILRKNSAGRSTIVDDEEDREENEILNSFEAPSKTAQESVSDNITSVKKILPKPSAVAQLSEKDDLEASSSDDDHDDEYEEVDPNPAHGGKSENLGHLEARVSALETAKTDLLAPLQSPFQPSSTTNDDKNRRYLVWNSIGNITLREERELRQNRVEIRFADTMGRNKQEAFADTNDFVMAALSHEGAIFATPLEVIDDETDNFRKPKGSMIHYHAFPAQAKMHGANETFDLHLPDNEEVTNVAVGTGWCAVATSNGFLRIFSSTGVQTNVFWLKGPAVTLVGSGSQLAVFYNASIPLGGTVQLRMDLYVLVWDRPGCNRCVAFDQAVPLTKGSTLQWAGIEADESQCVCIVDSYGMVSMLMKPLGWQWMPVLDVNRVKKDPSHVWWPIGVRKDKLSYVQLSGESRPLIYPQPVVTAKPLRIPIAEVPHGKDKEKVEAANLRLHELVWMQAMTAHKEVMKTEQDVFGLLPIEESSNETLEARYEKQQVEADKTVLKMLQEACKTHELAKAFDLAHKLRTMKALQAGKQIANKFGRPQVAAKLDDLLEERFQLQQLQQQADDYEESKAARPSVPPPRTPSQHDDGSHSHRHREDQPAKVVDIYQDTAVEDRESSHSVAVTPAEHQPFNPFKKAHHSPVKRKAGEYDVEDLKKMKSSPSPHKKPLLSRQSSFTETARSQKLSSNSFM